MRIAQINNYNYSRSFNYDFATQKNNQNSDTTTYQQHTNQPGFGMKNKIKVSRPALIFFIVAVAFTSLATLYSDIRHCFPKAHEIYELDQEQRRLKDSLAKITCDTSAFSNNLKKIRQ